MTLQKIAQNRELSRERIRQLLLKVTRILRTQKAKNYVLNQLRNYVTSVINQVPTVLPSEREKTIKSLNPENREKINKGAFFLEEIRKTHPRAYEGWTVEEEEELKKLFKEEKSITELAKHFQRNPGAIRSRINRLGFINE